MIDCVGYATNKTYFAYTLADGNSVLEGSSAI
jgi:hypothetical protein